MKDDYVKKLDSYLVTDNLIDYENRFKIDEKYNEYSLNNYGRWLIQDKATKIIFVKMDDGKKWDTSLSTEYLSKKPSMDDEYILLLDKNRTTILDCNLKTIKHINTNLILGKWAPNKNIYAYTEENENGTIKNLFCFYPDNLEIVQLNIGNRFYYGNFLWSPNGRYLLLFDLDEVYLVDVLKPSVKPKRIIKVKGNINLKRTEWSQDSKSVLTCYSDTTYNVFRPINYYLAKVNIKTKKINKVNLDDTLYGNVFWINENLALYELRTGLYKSEIDW